MKGVHIHSLIILIMSLRAFADSEGLLFFDSKPPSDVHPETTTSLPKAICSTCLCLSSHPFMVDCSDMNFKHIPKFRRDLYDLWDFHMTGNSLTNVSQFPYLPNMVAIDFRHNKISLIADAAFLNLTKLARIDFGFNKLVDASLRPGIFKGKSEKDKEELTIPLKDLRMNNNGISSLPKTFFVYTPNITYLDISHNPIKDIDPNSVEALSVLQKLEELHMKYASLHRLPTHLFSKLRNMRILDISGNLFTTVPTEVNFAPQLQVLVIDDTRIEVITRNAFLEDRLLHLTNLSISNTKSLHSVEKFAFGHLRSCRNLILSHNSLSAVAPTAFKNSRNETLNLTRIDLQNNKLERLSEEHLDWEKIHHPDLQNNPWRCTCENLWMAKKLANFLVDHNYDLSVDLVCSYPSDLAGRKMVETRVQKAKFLCDDHNEGYGHFRPIILFFITVAMFLVLTGVGFLVYLFVKKTKLPILGGRNVKYRRTEDEDSILY